VGQFVTEIVKKFNRFDRLTCKKYYFENIAISCWPESQIQEVVWSSCLLCLQTRPATPLKHLRNKQYVHT